MYDGKYKKLYEYLKRYSHQSTMDLTFSHIEEVLGFALPNSAYRYKQWWSNEKSGGHSQARAWMEAGWKKIDVRLGDRVKFEQKG